MSKKGGSVFMDSKRYRRYFIILDHEDGGFENSQGKTPKGYTKIEIKNGKGIISYYVQNLKYYDHAEYIYRGYLIGTKEGKEVYVDNGTFIIDESGKGELVWRFNPDNVDGQGNPIGDFNVIAIVAQALDSKVRENPITAPLVGFIDKEKVEWKHVLATQSHPEEQIEEELEEKYKDKIDKINEVIEKSFEKEHDFEEEEERIEEEEIGNQLDEGEILIIKEAEDLDREGIKEEERSGEEEIENQLDERETLIIEEIEGWNKGGVEEEGGSEEEIENQLDEGETTVIEKAEESVRDKIKRTENEVDEEREEQRKDIEEKDRKENIEPEENKEEIIKQPKVGVSKEEVEVEIDLNIKEEELEENEKRSDFERKDIGKRKQYEKYQEPVSKKIHQDFMDDKKMKAYRYKNPYKYYYNYFKMVYAYINNILKYYDRAEPFEKNPKGCTWWKIPCNPDTIYGKFMPFYGYISNMHYYPYMNYSPNPLDLIYKYQHYIFGIFRYSNHQPVYYIYGIPGRYTVSEQPCHGRTGFVSWYPLQDGEMQKGDYGYWFLYIDAKSGNLVMPSKPIPPHR